ncbi:Antiholin-like protein LrgB [[Clostridium] ultunense Esp]|uniref:Antiholin factor n=1 Tax=[Clostridium] ultunense Esp TaxID=1288971 RepID=M1Z4V0_9FIRM|nr:LrgB family protein [Schnuerera ultunensis]CCQ92769.1 Antiholin-like protein LrgB [[Clostridium] ultunense Esp]SHD75781.1 antiholin factor [[Clostridium] ultunense Esp]
MTMYLDTPLFGMTLSIVAFIIGIFINKKSKIAVFNPLLLSAIIIIGFLLYFDIDYETYNKGGSIISFFIAPATVVLAVPLYKNIKLLRERWFSILIGITVGNLAGLFTIFILSKFLEIDHTIMISMLPKSTTSAISMEIAEQIGGIPALAVAFTSVAGIGGNFIGEYILRLFKINDKVSKGVALGTASHALGTAKAIEIGDTEGALASLSIGVAGVISVFLIPWFMNLLSI